MKKEKSVKGYTRKSKSSKMVNVKPYSAKYDSAEDVKKMKMTSKEGSGSEFADLKKECSSKPKQTSLPFGDEFKKRVR